jgi:hypothetical protein
MTKCRNSSASSPLDGDVSRSSFPLLEVQPTVCALLEKALLTHSCSEQCDMFRRPMTVTPRKRKSDLGT